MVKTDSKRVENEGQVNQKSLTGKEKPQRPNFQNVKPSKQSQKTINENKICSVLRHRILS